MHYPPELRMIYDVIELQSEELLKNRANSNPSKDQGNSRLPLLIAVVMIVIGVAYLKRCWSKSRGEFLKNEESGARH